MDPNQYNKMKCGIFKLLKLMQTGIREHAHITSYDFRDITRPPSNYESKA